MKLNSNQDNIFFTSDTHAYHKNITRGVTSWDNTQRCRDFDTIEEMTNTLIKNINDKVPPDGILFHLGDWSFGGIDRIWEFRKRLNCKNIHLIYGNHDHHIINNRVLPNIYYDEPTDKYITGSPSIEEFKLEVNAHELFKSCDYYKEITIDGQLIIMSHYAMRVWNKSHHGSIMLYGHSHGTLPNDYKGEKSNISGNYLGAKTMDVGVDTNDLKPYSWEEIKNIMNRKQKLEVDHHNENTN